MIKTITRRKIIETGIKSSLLFPLLGQTIISCASKKGKNEITDTGPKTKLKILILGGTSFLGPHQISYALSRGHAVSTFTRGKTVSTVYKELFNDVEQLIGDRENDLTALEKGYWDVVIDNSGRKVDWTKRSAELLKDRSELYLYTSSTGVYYPYLGKDIDEKTALVLKEPANIIDEEEQGEYSYGVMKANSELEAIKAFGPERAIIVRPTYMIGPADELDRFIHWPIRLAKGGEVMVPGKIDDPVQYIDVRDVAEWMIRLAENKTTGIFNAVGPKITQTMPEFVELAQQAFDVEHTLIRIDDYDFLKFHKVSYLIPWIPAEGNNYGSARINNQEAINAGLTCRAIKDSVKDIYEWWYSDALTDQRRAMYEQNPESVLMREKAIIQAWRDVKKMR
ncbi:MAG: NAD-dependent epimerase/dehydratase family protein [Saprospiraceae bacterium]